MAVSYNPEDFVVSGGLFDEIDVQFTQCEFVMHDHTKSNNLRPYFKSLLVEDDGTEHENFWSCGDAEHMSPSLDGITPAANGPKLMSMPVGTDKQLRQSCDFFQLTASLANAGFNMATLSEGLDKLEDTVAHIIRVNAKGAFSTRKGADGKEYPRTIVTTTKIIRAPYDDGGDAKGTTDGREEESVSSKVSDAVEKAVVGALIDPAYVDGLGQKDLIKVIMAGVDAGQKKDALELAYDVNYMSNDDRPWKFVDGVIRGA